MKIIKGFLIDRKEGKFRPYDLEFNDYKDLQNVIHVNCFEIADRKFGNSYFSVYCDDEGLYKENNPLSIVTLDNAGIVAETIVGSVFICKHDEEGEIMSLTDEDIAEIETCIRNYRTEDFGLVLVASF